MKKLLVLTICFICVCLNTIATNPICTRPGILCVADEGNDDDDYVKIDHWTTLTTDDGRPIFVGTDGKYYFLDDYGCAILLEQQECMYCKKKFIGSEDDHKSECDNCCKHCNNFFTDYASHMLNCSFYNNDKNYCACGAVYDAGTTHDCPFTQKGITVPTSNNGSVFVANNIYERWEFEQLKDATEIYGQMDFVDIQGKHHNFITTSFGKYELVPWSKLWYFDNEELIRRIPSKLFYSMFNGYEIHTNWGIEGRFNVSDLFVENIKALYERNRWYSVHKEECLRSAEFFVKELGLDHVWVRVEIVQGEVAYYALQNGLTNNTKIKYNDVPYVIYGQRSKYSVNRWIKCVRFVDGSFVKCNNYDVEKVEQVIDNIVERSIEYHYQEAEDKGMEEGYYDISIDEVCRSLIGYDFHDIMPSQSDYYNSNSEFDNRPCNDRIIDFMEQHPERFFYVDFQNIESSFAEAQTYANRGHIVFVYRKDENNKSLIALILPANCGSYKKTCGWDANNPKELISAPCNCFASDKGLRAYKAPLSSIFRYDQFMDKNYRKDIKIVIWK